MKKILFSFLAIIMGISIIFSTPVFAETCECGNGEKGVATAIIGGGCVCDEGDGSSIRRILSTVINFLSIGVGIIGVLGVTIVGITYLTAGGNEEKTRKAKRRMLEIVIGLVAYVLIYALLNWLVPDFSPFWATDNNTSSVRTKSHAEKIISLASINHI